MEQSILKSTKKILGLDDGYTAFDLDIITHINAAFSFLDQLGVGPSEEIFQIVSESQKWDEFDVPENQLSVVKTYIFLKVRLLFDPPGTSFLLESQQKQISEFEWRLNQFAEIAAQTGGT